MKVIDLLNKIAYNEEMPKIIEVFGCEWEWIDEYCDYSLIKDDELNKFESSFLFTHIFKSSEYENKYALNEIVYLLDNEIEDNKIEKINKTDLAISINDIYNDNVDVLMNKINELIDEVNKLKGESNE